MKQHLRNIYRLGIKELSGLYRDKLMLILIIYSFSLGIYISAKAAPESISNAALAVVDEDHSALSQRLTDAFLPPMFSKVRYIPLDQVDPGMDKGEYTFVLVIPPDFQKDLLAGHDPALQLNVDATRMSQAFTGAGYIRQIADLEAGRFLAGDDSIVPAANLVMRNRFNPNLTRAWFSSVVQLINNISLLAVILTGAALIRERENGTLEHLMVLPLTPMEIMLSKVWSMALVVLTAGSASLIFMIQGVLKMPVEGSRLLFMLGMIFNLFAVTSLGIFLSCIAKNLPQLGILLILVLMPMDMLSGGMTPQESMPEAVRFIMQAAPATHFVSLSQAILYRGAGIEVVWKQFLALALIGGILFYFSLWRFKKSIAS
ncbi:MAG: ABC transporter permease [Lentisphaeria bacterium]|nr:ABC transporter permease [Lentisphaeria bacterium]